MVLSAALFMHHEGFLHYHLSGSDPRANQLGLNNLMIWEAARQGAALGARQLHLGGGTRADDPLYRFKASFGPHRLAYAATGLIIDAPAYDMLREAAGTRATTTSFFPAYRADAHD
jgi:lipid II:glycine glycyltransferase (peptidoglycan interpeptide bridge formation enzyme)